MVPSSGSIPDIESVRAVIFVVAAAGAIFWRALLRLLLAVIVVAVGVGGFVLLHGLHG